MKHILRFLAVLTLFISGVGQLSAQSAFSGLYVGRLYQTITGTISVPRSAIGAVNFTIDESGNIIGNITGTVDAGGNITWNANTLGFSTGFIDGAGLLTSTAVDVQAAVTVTSEIEAQNQAGGFGNGGSVVSNFEWRSPTPTGGTMNSVAYGDGKFVAVGEGGVAAFSDNGTDWFSLYIPAGVDLNGVAYGNGKWVVVGDDQTAFYSSDLSNWTPTVMGGAFQKINDITFGNGKFVVAGLTGIYTSTDGAAWSTAYSNSFDTFNSVQYEGGLFIVCSDPFGTVAGQILVSPDGSTWTPRTLANGVSLKASHGNGTYAVTFSQAVYTFTQPDASDLVFHATSRNADCIGFINGKFIDEDFYKSSDGAIFTRNGYINTDINDFVTAEGRIIGVGRVIISSADGNFWEVHTNSGIRADPSNYYNAEISGVGLADGSLAKLRVGPNGLIEVDSSGDGNFSPEVSPTSEDLNAAERVLSGTSGAIIVGDNGTIIRYVHDFTPGSGRWEIVPSGTVSDLTQVVTRLFTRYFIAGKNGTLLKSEDRGVTWTNDSVSGVTEDLGIAYRSLQGNQVLTGYYAYGANGTILNRGTESISTWTDISIPASTKTIVGVAIHQGTNYSLVAVASDGTLFYTRDKVTWTEVPNLIGAAVVSIDPLAISVTDENGIEHEIVYNGIPPVGTSFTPNINNFFFRSVVRGNGRFVAVGDTTVAASTDGISWQRSSVPSTQFFNMCFGNGIFLATGDGPGAQPVLYRSSDGLNWTQTVLTPALDFSSLAAGNGIIVGAERGTQRFYYSSDGVSWTAGDSHSGKSIHDIEFTNGRFVAVGTTTYTSVDGMSWTGGTANTGQMYDVDYHNGLYVAVGSVANVSSNRGMVISSPDGLSWTTRTPPAPSGGTVDILRAVRYAGGTWIAVGDNNTGDTGAIVIDSADGLSWNLDHMNFDGDINGLAAANGQLIAVGQQGTIFGIAYADSDSPYLTSQPVAPGTIGEGGNIMLTATAGGTGTLHYQWARNGIPLIDGGPISGATSSSLSIDPISLADQGNYTVSISNDSGSVISQAVAVDIAPLPIISTPPSSMLANAGGNASFTVVAVGEGLSFQWFRNGTRLNGEESATLALTSVDSADAGRYHVEVSNAVGTRPSPAATLSVQTLAGSTNLALDTVFNANVPVIESTFLSPTNFEICAINDIHLLPSGKVIVAGQFEYNHPTLGRRSSILRLNADGTIDASYTPPTILSVSGGRVNRGAMISSGLLSDGRVFAYGGQTKIGADFTTGSGGTAVAKLILFNADGTVDTSFSPPSAIATQAGGVAIDASDRLLVAGYGINTGNHRFVSRLDASGTMDATFNSSALGSGATKIDQPVDRPFLFQSDGKILLAAYYNNYSGMGVRRLNENGSPDATFADPDVDARWIQHLFHASDGGFYAVGSFRTVEGRPQYGIGKFDADGNLDSAYNADATGDDPNYYWDGRELPGGSVLGIGATSFGALMTRGIDLLDSSGDSTPSAVLGAGFAGGNAYGSALGSNADNSILFVGGNVETLDGNPVPKLMKFSASAGSGTAPALAILNDPLSVEAEAGDSVSFSVSAVGAALDFQWYKGGVLIEGETSPSLQINNAELSDAGTYTVEVSDASGTLTSAPASLSIGGNIGGYTSFAASFPEGLRGEDDDGNGNGISNLFEYAFHITDGDRAKLPSHGIQTAAELGLGGSDRYLTLTYRMRNNDPGLSMIPKAAFSLNDLPSGGANVVMVGSPIIDGDVSIFTYRTTFTVSTNPTGFMMLEIIIP